jgi:hypothetical protein
VVAGAPVHLPRKDAALAQEPGANAHRTREFMHAGVNVVGDESGLDQTAVEGWVGWGHGGSLGWGDATLRDRLRDWSVEIAYRL